MQGSPLGPDVGFSEYEAVPGLGDTARALCGTMGANVNLYDHGFAAWGADMPAEPPSAFSRCCRVLVLDDDKDMLRTLDAMCQKLGAPVQTCASWSVFEAALGTFKPDLVLIDLMMPDVDGIEALERVAGLCDADLYVMTGADKRTLEASLEVLSSSAAVVAGYLQKPFSLAGLKAVLDAPRQQQKPPVTAAKSKIRREVLTPDQFKKAVLDQRIDPFFQPIFHADGERLKGFEALARVWGENQSFFAPEYLIQLVHDDRLAMILTQIITKKALRFLASLNAAGNLSVSINIFGFQAADHGYFESLLQQCAEHGIAHERVILELSEANVFRLTTDDLRKITKLRLAGFGLSIDDLGTGDSSLGRLASLPFSEMKIDKSFCLSVLQSDAARAVVEACLGLAKRLQMKVTAEGVENEEIAGVLREMGCDALQGHYFGQALAPDRVQPWIDAGCPRYEA